MKSFNRILVPTDFSTCADAAVLRALDLRQRFDTTMTLVHVCQLPVAYPGVIFSDAVLRSMQDGARAQLERVREWIDKKQRESNGARPMSGVETNLLLGVPEQEIVDEAKRGNYDLIVMGTHGRTGFKHLFMGSVAERVVRGAPCPVLTVRDERGGKHVDSTLGH